MLFIYTTRHSSYHIWIAGDVYNDELVPTSRQYRSFRCLRELNNTLLLLYHKNMRYTHEHTQIQANTKLSSRDLFDFRQMYK